MRTLAYSVLDVFAERALDGNALAVFHDGRGLSDSEMQAIARETNLSETTFVLPADDPDDEAEHGVRVRIFTTQEELPFAGHPTLGTASWLHLHHPPTRNRREVILRLTVGPIPVRFDGESSGGIGVQATMRQSDPVFGEEYDPEEVARIIGLSPGDLLPGFAPQSVSTGNPFCIVPLRDLSVLGRLAIPQQQATEWLHAHGIRWFYCIAAEDAADLHCGKWRARMQFYSGEDPATGSAAGPCISWLVRLGLVRPDRKATIRQGVEMLRPSLIHAQASLNNLRVHSVLVGGRTIPVAVGSFFLL